MGQSLSTFFGTKTGLPSSKLIFVE